MIYIDAEDEWESIYAGRLTDEAITKRRTKLRELQLEAEKKHFPDGFDPDPKLIKVASAQANTYFSLTFNEEASL